METLTDKSRTKPRILEGLHILALLRYSTHDILKAVKKTALRIHIFSKPTLSMFSEHGLIEEDPYRLTAKGFDLLRKNGYTLPYQERLQGGGEHDLQVAGHVLQEIYSEDFYHVYYPNFHYMRPDALFVHKKDGAYKLTFLEVELSAKTDDYLEIKKRNYERLSQDFDIWDKWWRLQSKRLRLPFCTTDNFCFSVRWV